VQQDCDKLISLSRQLPMNNFDIQAYMFGFYQQQWAYRNMVIENIALLEEIVHTHQ
jgi:isochorismate hydrolase